MSLSILNIGKVKIFAQECTSTNLELKALLNSQAIDNGTIYHTNYQTAGRGQQQNTWQSNANQNVLMSIFLKPTFLGADEQAYLNMAVSLAVNQVVAKLVQTKTYIKWPNDIMVDDQKIAGLLVENVLQNNKIKYSIVGVGLNVNQAEFNQINATSLKLLTGQNFLVLEVLDLLCKALEKYYLWLNQRQFDKITENYTQHLYAKGQLKTFKINQSKIQGEIMGVNKTGKLFVLINGEIKSFGNKEIELVY